MPVPIGRFIQIFEWHFELNNLYVFELTYIVTNLRPSDTRLGNTKYNEALEANFWMFLYRGLSHNWWMLNGDTVNNVCKDKLTKLIKFSATILYHCINLLKTSEDH